MARYHRISSYNDALNALFRAKKKSEGKPLGTAFRLYQDGDNFEIRIWGWPFCIIYPDDTLFVHMDATRLEQISVFLARHLHKILPIAVSRLAKDRYFIHSYGYQNSVTNMYVRSQGGSVFRLPPPTPKQLHAAYDLDQASRVCYGAHFNLKTGTCLFAMPDVIAQVNPEARREWLRKLRAFKRDIKTRHKLGIVDALMQQRYTAQEYGGHFEFQVLAAAIADTGKVLDCLKTYCYIAATRAYYPQGMTSKDIINNIEGDLNMHSVGLRKHFGVFTGGEA